MIQLVTNYESNYSEDPVRYFNFTDYNDNTIDCLLFVGGHPHNSIFGDSHLPKYFLSTEEQTWDLDSTDRYVDNVEKIFTICDPRVTGRRKREFSFFPINKNVLPTTYEKKFDVVYAGFAGATHISDLLSVIMKYNYCFISFSNSIGGVTHMNVSYPEKLNLIGQSKISVVHNLCANNTPQLKSRPFESALCKSLILCKKDEFNFIETWFEPNVDFLYYETNFDLESTINKVISNYNDYQFMIDNAYHKAINNYTTEAFVLKNFSRK
jgi:hypothetical protein